MWVRPSVARTPRFSHVPFPYRRALQQSLKAFSLLSSRRTENDFFFTRELADDLHVIAEPSTEQNGSSSSDDDVADAATLWLPFQNVSLTYTMHPALRSLTTSHALLFASLASTPDLLLQLTTRNPCGGGVAAVRLRCAAETFALTEPYRHDAQRLLALPAQYRHLVDEIRLVQLITSPSPNASLLVSRELEHLRGSDGGWSRDVLWVLLSVPCAVEVLRAVLEEVVARHSGPGGMSAYSFQRTVHALLSNDNFFCERSFDGMHRLLLEVVLPSLKSCSSKDGGDGDALSAPTTRPPTFDFLAVRWMPLMNKWSRVYAKRAEGFLLYDCLRALRHAVPPVETKLPSSLYVRLLGALLDASVAADNCAVDKTTTRAADGWTKIKLVANDALRLFGRNAADLRSIWVLLLKAALILHPLRDSYQRLLEAYHVCAACGHTAPLDRQGFLQVTRLVSEAIRALRTPDVLERVVPLFCGFMYEQDNANFLWLLDGVGATLTDLWEAHGAAAAGAAQELLAALEKLLRDRRVTGVDVQSNPVIARALRSFQLGGPVLFWWRCGCGEELPCTARRCTACLRTSGASWTCAACGAAHKVLCGVQRCPCGTPNPRLAAATQANYTLCEHCGEMMNADGGGCVRCEEQQSAQSQQVECAHCHQTYKVNALHCPHCYTVNPSKSSLYLWHCEGCDDFNYSIWSSCRTCKAGRKSGAFLTPFVPWACGCGALNHPGRLTCGSCGTGARHHTFTCVGCYAHVAIRSLRRVAVVIDGKTIPLHFCPRCRALHPRSDLLLYSPMLSRHCMFCARTIYPSSVAAHGAFHHCNTVHNVNENYVFRCRHCTGERGEELQTGYHCKHCLFPRPEVEGLMAAAEANQGAAAAVAAETTVTVLWRCLHEGEEGELCGQWNYGWSGHCAVCGTGRPESAFECRAKAQLWQCKTCGQANRPIDVLFCSSCKRGVQPVQRCGTCGMPHLTFSCRVHLQHFK
jgi:hypothetical protein